MKYLIMIVFCFLVATIASLVGVFILQSTGLIGTADTDFKNLPYGIAIGFNLYLFLGSFPVLLNLNERVKANTLWSSLSFFLLPFIFVLLSLLAMWDEPWPGVLFCLPYLIILFILFLRFRKEVASTIA
ncbi:MAG: hypothetical protein EOO93_10990 [Pedobacter sp.]|nr:MAG: hypothetical protein EOO93_10990 [Pedobacter sp.]